MEKAEREQHQQVRHPGRREVQPDTRGETPAGDSTTINRRGEAEAGGATDKGNSNNHRRKRKRGGKGPTREPQEGSATKRQTRNTKERARALGTCQTKSHKDGYDA